MGTALVVGLLVVMCGGIAYVGDLLGWRMGKRRLSLFGLRPRHTAVVFTVITGMLIAAVTLGILMLASAGVRIAVTRGEQLLYENHRLKQQQRVLAGLRLQLIRRKDDLEKANTELARFNGALRAEEDRLRAQTGKLQQHNQALQGENQKLGLRNQRLDSRNASLTRGNQTLTSRNRALAADNGRLTRSKYQLAGTNRRLTTSNARLQGLNRRLQTAKAGLVQARDRAQAQLTTVRGDLIRTQADLTHARADLQQVQHNALEVAERMRPLSQRGQELATGVVVIRKGEELARRVIPAGAPAEVVRGTLQSLLSDADAEVARRVGQGPGHVRHVCLDPHGEPPDQLSERTVMALMTESHPIDGQIPLVPMPEIHPLVVRALASQNAAAESTEPVEVDVAGQVNRLAFRRGEEVASLRLSTAATSGQLLKSLVTFLQRQVRESAIERSVLPDAADSVQEIDYGSLLDVVAKVRRLSGWVRVGAVAATDTWTAGPLRLDFYVVPAAARVATE